ncbi:MAG: isoprenylcysteine carboxylmethyltransferase family protein [Smithella sp.]|nr:isoprenylcysteine carboxylmethyltransferase family protein [Smithella sp.]
MNRYPLLIMIVLLALCWGISLIFPLNLGLGLMGKVAGFLIAFVGIFLLIIATGLFMARKTTVMPTRAPDKLVTEGIYRITRNPMYLGMLLILSGFPLMMDTIIGLICPAIFFFLMDRIVIPREEKVVEGVFGKDYLDYKSLKRRWI